MSKNDDLRAMREARYAQNAARAKTATKPAAVASSAPAATSKATTSKAAKRPAARPTEAQSTDVQPCGHRAISGRTCTRDQGHSEKNHRYS